MSQESAYFIATSVSGKQDVKAIKRRLDALHGVHSVSVQPRHNLCLLYTSQRIGRVLQKLNHTVIANDTAVPCTENRKHHISNIGRRCAVCNAVDRGKLYVVRRQVML